MTNAVTTPTAPAPMTAERLKHIRDNYQRLGEAALERHCGELLAHIDALTARAERERERWIVGYALADRIARAAIEALAANVTDEMVKSFERRYRDATGKLWAWSEDDTRGWISTAIYAALSDGQKGGG